MNRTLYWASTIVVIALAGAACSPSPEGFCEDWALDTCDVLGRCCTPGTKFDAASCRIDLSNVCQAEVQVERVHAGEVEFHAGSARACFPSFESCNEVEALQRDDSFERWAACGSIVTGFRPVGSSCTSDDQCESAGERSICWTGDGGSSGVCAAVALDEKTCSFSLSSNELRVCPDGKFCALTKFDDSPSSPPSARQLEFKAHCTPYVRAGESCIEDGFVLPCVPGVYCDPAAGICVTAHEPGESCQDDSECGVGHFCAFDPSGIDGVCVDPAAQGLFCFDPG
jgi:hypothetical protein